MGEFAWPGCAWLIKEKNQEDLELHVGRKLGQTLSVGSVETWIFHGHPALWEPLITTAHRFNAEQRRYGTWARFMMEMEQIVVQNEGSRADF